MRYRNVWSEATLTSVELVADNVRQLEIMPLEGTQVFTAGSHIDVSIHINGLPALRSYSLVGVYEAGKPYRIAVKRLLTSKGGSAYMWEIKPGDRLTISKPINHFELSTQPAKYYLIAGGIGITPLIGMAKALMARSATVNMLYAGSARNEMPFIDELAVCLGERLRIHAVKEQSERVNVEKLIAELDNDVVVYLCGPLGLMNEVRKQWEQTNKPVGNLRFETFGASGLFAPQAFKVAIPRLELDLIVQENQSLLDVLNQAGAAVMYDCKKRGMWVMYG